jgi:hypothetical protein
MEKLTKEIYKVNKLEFLTKKEAELYEKTVNDNELRKEIITCLIEDGYTEVIGKQYTLCKEYHLNTVQYKFISDIIIVKVYRNDSSVLAYWHNPTESNVTINLCELDVFKSFNKVLYKH